MADSTRDIELRLRARDLSTAELKQVIASVNELSRSLDQQLAAASRLEIKERELKATLQQFDQAARNVTGIDAIIQRAKLLSDQLQRNQADVDKTRAALEVHKAAMASGAATGRAAETALNGFEKALAAAEGRLQRNQTALSTYNQQLERAGVDTRNLVAAEQQLLATATQIGDARTKLNNTIANYARLEREAREAAKAKAQADRDAAEAAKQKAAADAAAAKAELDARRARLGSGPTGFREFSQRIDRERELNVLLARLNRERANDETRQARLTVDAIRQAERDKQAARRQTFEQERQFRQLVPTTVPRGGGILETGPTRGAGAPIGFLGLRPYELTNLGYQINDVISGLAMGQNMTQILAQQGGQFIQIFGRAALRWFPLVVTAAGAVAIAINGITNAVRTLASNREFEAALRVNSTAADLNAQSLTALRKELRDLGVDWEDAGKAIRAAITANVRPEFMREFLLAARSFARVEGIEVAEAAKALSDGISGSIEEFDRLAARFPLLSDRQRDYIRELIRSGQQGKAQVEILRLLGEAYKKAEDQQLSDFQKAVERLTGSWKRLMDRMGESDAIQGVISRMTNLVNWLDRAVQSSERLSANEFIARRFGIENVVRGFEAGTIPGSMWGVARSLLGLPSGPVGGPGRFVTGNLPVNTEELRTLVSILSEATRGLPPGYRAEAISTHRPGATVRDTGRPSEHAAGRAIDVRIVDANGRPVPGAMGAGGPIYDMLDKAVAAIAASRGIPVAIGSTFTRKDAGHYSIGGREAAITAGRISPDGSASGPVTVTGPRPEDIDRAKELIRVQQESLAVSRASSRLDEENQVRQQALLKIRETIKEVGTEEERAAARRLQNEYAENEVLKLREQRRSQDFTREQTRSRQAEEDLRNLLDRNAIEAAGERAREEAQRRQISNFDQLEQIRDAAEAQERQRQQQARQDLDAIENLQKRIDDLRRQSLSQQKSAIDQLNEATNLKYDQELRNIEKVAERRGNVDKAALDAMKAQTEELRQQELARNVRTAAERQATDALAARQDIIQAYMKLEAAGEITITEKENRIKEAYGATREAILGAADSLEQYIRTAKDLPESEIMRLTARVKELRAESKYIDPFWKGLKETFSGAFTQGLDTAFNTISEAIGGAIAKTKEWKDVWTSVKNAALNFFATLLRELASYILKAQAAKLASNLFSGSGGFLGSLFGGGSSAAAAGSAASSTASTGIFGLGFLGLKKGGVVGQVPPSGINDPSWWAGAPRYRNGAIVGLAPDEQRAILHRGEEVLSADNPRNILNGGGGPGQVLVRNVLVDDRRRIAEALEGAHGERVIVQTLLRNAATVRELARG